MRRFVIIIILLIGNLFLTCNNRPEIQVTELTQEETENPPEPPPPSFSCSTSTTLQEWFFKLCDTEKPGSSIITYNLGFFETDNCYAIYLNSKDSTSRFSALSKNEYKGLDWKQTLTKMKSQLKEFTGTEKFRSSSLAKAKAINIHFDDGDLLSLK